MEIKNRRDELLLLVAISGELPAAWSGYVVHSETYAATLLTQLKKDGYINVRRKDGLKGYQLRVKAKQYLMETYGEDVALYLSGGSCTNHVKSEPEKRLRLHRMSMVWIFYHRAGIRIFKSDKGELFPGFHLIPSGVIPEEKCYASAYYGTLEWKLETDKEIKGSRACGILAGSQVYVIYNTMDTLMKWAPKTERNLKSRIEMRMRRSRGGDFGGAIIMGNQMSMAKRLIESDGGLKGTLYRLDDVYESVYYIPLIDEAMLQLRLLNQIEKQKQLDSFLCGTLKHKNENLHSLDAGTDNQGERVYFCYLFNLWQIRRVLGQPYHVGGRVFCFTYQASTLREVFPESYTIEAIQPEKAEQYLGFDNVKE